MLYGDLLKEESPIVWLAESARNHCLLCFRVESLFYSKVGRMLVAQGENLRELYSILYHMSLLLFEKIKN